MEGTNTLCIHVCTLLLLVLLIAMFSDDLMYLKPNMSLCLIYTCWEWMG